MKPYYELDDLTKKRILGLIKTCESTELGNIRFEYYDGQRVNAKSFVIEQYKYDWQLIVIDKTDKTRDIYKIIGDQISHDYSEND